MFGIRTEGPGTQPTQSEVTASALESKPRYAANVVKPAGHRATARTNVPFGHAGSAYYSMVFEVTTYQPAICVMATYALCVTAKKNQKVATTPFAHVLLQVGSLCTCVPDTRSS